VKSQSTVFRSVDASDPFPKLFRLNKQCCMDLIDNLRSNMTNDQRTSVSKCITEVPNCIVTQLMHQRMKFPNSPQARPKKQGFLHTFR
jgi:hypothetical protein